MAGRGQIPNPALRRYDDVPTAPGVYVIEAGDAVKIGRASSLRSRLPELHSYLIRNGRTPGRFFYLVALTDHIDAEARCLRAMRKVSNGVTPKSEYFTGIDFDGAVRVVSEVC